MTPTRHHDEPRSSEAVRPQIPRERARRDPFELAVYLRKYPKCPPPGQERPVLRRELLQQRPPRATRERATHSTPGPQSPQTPSESATRGGRGGGPQRPGWRRGPPGPSRAERICDPRGGRRRPSRVVREGFAILPAQRIAIRRHEVPLQRPEPAAHVLPQGRIKAVMPLFRVEPRPVRVRREGQRGH